jgi:hypothetical protein
MKAVFVFLLVIATVLADLYMQNPRGSNDRLNEANTNRNNGNRLFDSQNNAKGGYCWGPSMTFYEGSLLTIEWTNQHGCGSNPKLQCNLVIQYMCSGLSGGPYQTVRDGETTDTITANAAGPTALGADGGYLYGMHEPLQYYLDCQTRLRDNGLYVADRVTVGGLNLLGPSTVTRQNNNGQQNGFECPEERDYYPYWHPSPWVDVAVLTSNTAYCSFYQSNSQNVMSKGYCQPKSGPVTDPTQPSQTTDNNPTTCAQNGNTWVMAPSWGLAAPDCQQVPWGRENHLGNSVDGHNAMYNWTLPKTGDVPCISNGDCQCVLRMRYNISEIENGYPSMSNPSSGFMDYTYNAANSPFLQNPIVAQDPSVYFQLAMDTSQYGRTFQDRSFVFHIAKRPGNVPALARVFNLNVRGKRGNIVQAYPATEYDFVPSYLYTRVGDYIHFQWTGCDQNPAGNAGEGTDQTDRSNIVQIATPSSAHPVTAAWISAHPSWVMFPNTAMRIRFAMLDQYNCLNQTQLLLKDGGNANTAQEDVQNCMKLNAADQYFDGGVVKMNTTGTYYYMSTRNHNFTNRDQKGILYVVPLLPTWAIALLVIGGVVFLGAFVVAGLMFYSKSHPHSQVANLFSRM